ncbi:AtpZ/AtpI family protein [Mucilaginibacter sp.]
MPENQPNEKQVSNALKYTGIGFQMIAVIGLLTFVGYEIDKHYQHTTQWATAVFSLLGVFVSLFITLKSLKD